jgi:hypothetical protein
MLAQGVSPGQKPEMSESQRRDDRGVLKAHCLKWSLVFRPSAACSSLILTQGLRSGLQFIAASRLEPSKL